MRTFTTGTIQCEPASNFDEVARFLRGGRPCPRVAGGDISLAERFLKRHANVLTVRATGTTPDILASIGVFEDAPGGDGELAPGKPVDLRAVFVSGLRLSAEVGGYDPDLGTRLLAEATMLVAAPDDDGLEPDARLTTVLAAIDLRDVRMVARMSALGAVPIAEPPAWAARAASDCAATPAWGLWWLSPTAASRSAAWLADRHPDEVATRINRRGQPNNLGLVDRTWRRWNAELVRRLASGSSPVGWVAPFEGSAALNGA